MPETTRAVAKVAPGPGLEMIEVPIPRAGPREALVNMRACSICGTDVHIYRWDPWAQSRSRPPLVIGHEICGEVVDVGDEVQRVKVAPLPDIGAVPLSGGHTLHVGRCPRRRRAGARWSRRR